MLPELVSVLHQGDMSLRKLHHPIVQFYCHESPRQILFPTLPHKKRHLLHVRKY